MRGFVGLFVTKQGWNLPLGDPAKSAKVAITSDKYVPIRGRDGRLAGAIGFDSVYNMEPTADDTLSFIIETDANYGSKDQNFKLTAAMTLVLPPAEQEKALEDPVTRQAVAISNFQATYDGLFGVRGTIVGMKFRSREMNLLGWLRQCHDMRLRKLTMR